MERYIYEGLLLAIRLRCNAFSASTRDQMFRNASRCARNVLTEKLGQEDRFALLRSMDLSIREGEAVFMLGVGIQQGWLRRDNGHGVYFVLSREDAEARLRNLPEARHFMEAADEFATHVRQLPQAA